MIRSIRNVVCAAAVGAVFTSSQAFAFLDVQALVGQKTAEFSGAFYDQNEATSNQLKVAAHINPLPLPMVTFGVGLFFSTENYDVDVTKHGVSTTESGVQISVPFKELTGYSVGPDFFLGFSIPGIDLMPYARMSYAIAAITAKGDATTNDGTNEFTEADSDFAMVGKGIHTSIGVAYSPLPLISIMAEYEFGEDTMEIPELKEGSVVIPALEGTMKTSSLLLGVEIGI